MLFFFSSSTLATVLCVCVCASLCLCFILFGLVWFVSWIYTIKTNEQEKNIVKPWEQTSPNNNNEEIILPHNQIHYRSINVSTIHTHTHTPGIYRNGPEQNWGAWSRGRRLHISENEPPNTEWCLWPAIYTVFMGHYNNVLIASLMWIYLHRMNLSNPNVCLIWTFSKYTDTHIGHTHTITNAGRMLRIEYNQIYIYIYPENANVNVC